MHTTSPRTRALTQIDCLALLVVTACLASVVLAATTRTAETANRVECQKNLLQIGRGLIFYSNENKGLFPRTVANASGKVTFFTVPAKVKSDGQPADPFGKEEKPEPNDLTAALFLLLRTQDLTSDVFVCPGTSDKADDFGGKTAAQRMNFSSPFNLSYSFINVYPSAESIQHGFRTFMTAFPSTFAVAADLNPGSDALTKLTSNSADEDLRKGNSTNHQSDGQNVLYADGHAEFQRTPLCGSNHDNIFTYGDNEGIVGPPANLNDSILLPTAKERPANADPAKIPGRPRKSAATQPAVQPTFPGDRLGLVGHKFVAENGNFVRIVTPNLVDVHEGAVTYAGAISLMVQNYPVRIVLTIDGSVVVRYYTVQPDESNTVRELADEKGVSYKLSNDW